MEVSFEVNASISDGMPEYRFRTTGILRGAASGNYDHGYVMGLNVYDKNGTVIFSEDFSEFNDYIDMPSGLYLLENSFETMGLEQRHCIA